jgi:hypothetical protein
VSWERRLGLLVLGAAAGCGGGGRQEYPTAEFPFPSDTILAPYVHPPIGGWLGGSRWFVVAGEYNEAALVDFGAKQRRALTGRDAAEIRNPFGGFASADTAWITDWALRRATLWTSEGRAAGMVPAPEALRGALPSARDAAGQLYFEVRPEARRDGSGNRDSAAVVRMSADATRFDTMARLSPLDLAEVEEGGVRRLERRVFSGQDRWGVLRDGTLWVARVYRNEVIWRDPAGTITQGPGLPDRVIEVSRVDREHWLLQFPEELRSTAERLPYTPIKPPFENGLTTPGGEIWLEKSRAATDSVRTYHVINRRGELTRVLILPSRQGHIIAVGDTLALVAEQWKEGVRLMQVRIPVTP